MKQPGPNDTQEFAPYPDAALFSVHNSVDPNRSRALKPHERRRRCPICRDLLDQAHDAALLESVERDAVARVVRIWQGLEPDPDQTLPTEGEAVGFALVS